MYTALSASSETLTQFIQTALAEAMPDFFDPAQGGNWIVTSNNPQEMVADEDGVSVWLYRLDRDEYRLNDPPQRTSQEFNQRQPLPVRLHYLVTPIISLTEAQGHEVEQRILGRILQVFHDAPMLRGINLRGDFEETAVELRIRLEPMSLEEITRVWDALDRAYQLSISYEVSVVFIESANGQQATTPVDVPLPNYGLIVGRESG